MRVHSADAEIVVDTLSILGEVVIGDGILVTELVLGLFYLAPLLHVAKLVLFSFGLAGADAAYLRRHVLDVLDLGLVGGLLGGNGDIVVGGRIIAEAISGCHCESVGLGWIVGADAMGDVLVMRVGEVVARNGGHDWHWLLLLLELYLQLV